MGRRFDRRLGRSHVAHKDYLPFGPSDGGIQERTVEQPRLCDRPQRQPLRLLVDVRPRLAGPYLFRYWLEFAGGWVECVVEPL